MNNFARDFRIEIRARNGRRKERNVIRELFQAINDDRLAIARIKKRRRWKRRRGRSGSRSLERSE